MKTFLFLILVLACGCHKKNTTPVQQPAHVEVSHPKLQDVNLYNSYIGHISPFVQVDVTAQVEGVLTGYYFVEGQEVKAGDLLFTIDSRPYDAQLAKAEATLAQNKVNLHYAKDVLQRNTELAAKNYVSKLQFENYETNVLATEASILQNEADIEAAKINISYCNIHAPMDALTGKLKIQAGNLIQNGSSPLITLNQISPVYAYFSAPQKDLPQLMTLHRKEILKAEAFLEGDPSPHSGFLDLIDNQMNDQTGSILLRIVLPNENKILWPGEFVDIHLITREIKEAILVPNEAIFIGQKGKFVYTVKQDNTLMEKYVKTGQVFGNHTLILEGLEADDTIAIQGSSNLGSGMKIEPITRDISQ